MLFFAFCSNCFAETDHQDVYQGMRALAFSHNPADIGIKNFTPNLSIFCILMEFKLDERTISLVGLIDGSASLYYSTGGGIIGGGGENKVGEAAKIFVYTADKFPEVFTKTETFPLPQNKNEIYFYAITKNGVYRTKGSERDLVNGRHVLSPLFYAGNNLLTEIRIREERTANK